MITIYQIYNDKYDDFYIGSTLDYQRRQWEHKSNCCNTNSKNYNLKLYQFIRNNGGFDEWKFKILNEIEYIDDVWKRRQEQIYIDLMKPSLNTLKAFLSDEDKVEANRKWDGEYRKTEERKTYMKEYQKTDEYKEYQKQYEKSDKRKEYKKEYQKTDEYKEYKKQYDKTYYQKKKLANNIIVNE